MTDILYVAIVRSSDCDRSDICYVGHDKQSAERALFASYNDVYEINQGNVDEAFCPKYKTISDFIFAATMTHSSAYIACYDHDISFELHECFVSEH